MALEVLKYSEVAAQVHAVLLSERQIGYMAAVAQVTLKKRVVFDQPTGKFFVLDWTEDPNWASLAEKYGANFKPIHPNNLGAGVVIPLDEFRAHPTPKSGRGVPARYVEETLEIAWNLAVWAEQIPDPADPENFPPSATHVVWFK